MSSSFKFIFLLAIFTLFDTFQARVVSTSTDNTKICDNKDYQMFDKLELVESSLKDIKIPHLEVNLTIWNIPDSSGMIILDNIIISGLQTLKLCNVQIKPIIIGGVGVLLKATFTLPDFNITTNYNANCVINKYVIFGSGCCLQELKELTIDFDISLLFSPFTISKFRILPSVADIKVKITGFFNDVEQSALLGQIVDDAAVQWLNEKASDLADIIEEFVKGLINYDLYVTSGYYADIEAVLETYKFL